MPRPFRVWIIGDGYHRWMVAARTMKRAVELLAEANFRGGFISRGYFKAFAGETQSEKAIEILRENEEGVWVEPGHRWSDEWQRIIL